MTSGRRERSSPLLSALCGHPRHCSATSGTATTSLTLLERTGTGRRHARHCTSYGPPLTAPVARQPASAPLPSKSLLYGHRTRHDTPTGARFARMVVNSVALLATPPHVGEQCGTPVNCSPLAYKRRGSTPAAGDGTMDSDHAHAFRLHHNIGTRLNQYLWDLEARPPLPPRL
jgi:hypothetical protein